MNDKVEERKFSEASPTLYAICRVIMTANFTKYKEQNPVFNCFTIIHNNKKPTLYIDIQNYLNPSLVTIALHNNNNEKNNIFY